LQLYCELHATDSGKDTGLFSKQLMNFCYL